MFATVSARGEIIVRNYSIVTLVTIILFHYQFSDE